MFAGAEIPKSPFTVNVEDSPLNPDNVIVKGPGLQPGNTVGNPTYFDVITTGAVINTQKPIAIACPT